MIILALAWVAHASTFNTQADADWAKQHLKNPWGTSFVEQPLAPAIAEAPLVFEATVVRREYSYYLSSSGGADGFVAHLEVTRPLKGTVESGFINLWNATLGLVEPGQRLLFVGGPKKMQLTSMVNHDKGWLGPIPYYEDLVVPLWQDSIVLDTNPQLAAAAAEISHACFEEGAFHYSSTLDEDGRYCTEASWQAMVSHIAELAADTADSGLTIAGARPEPRD